MGCASIGYGDGVAIGSPILLSAMLDELGESIEKGLVYSDMVESKNDEEKLGMPQRQHFHETLFDARRSIHVFMPMHALWNHWSHVSQHTP